MRTAVLALSLLLVVEASERARGGETKITEAEVAKATKDLREQMPGTISVFIIDSPREPFVRAAQFKDVVLLAGRPFYRFRQDSAFVLLDPSRIFAIVVDAAAGQDKAK
jgi:hypothetical protein